jgi:hypothetical protein
MMFKNIPIAKNIYNICEHTTSVLEDLIMLVERCPGRE